NVRSAAAEWSYFERETGPTAAAAAVSVGARTNPTPHEAKTMQHVYEVEIQGISPLIQNNPAEALKGMAKNSRRKATPSVEPDEEWRIKVYTGPDGKTLQHPSIALESILKEAASTFKAEGRGAMKTAVKRTRFIN